MKTFSDRWRQLDWDDIRLRINGKTAADVEHALNASQLSRDDLMALLSPAAADFLEPLAQRAQRLTRQRFGNTEWITFVAICPPFAASLPHCRWKFSRCQRLNMRS